MRSDGPFAFASAIKLLPNLRPLSASRLRSGHYYIIISKRAECNFLGQFLETMKDAL
jgi:hypothetical protein